MSTRHPVPGRCPMCGCEDMHGHFVYTEPPPLEHHFDSVKAWQYHREVHRCARCGHYLEHLNADLSDLYKGDYAATIWGDAASMRATFDKINALPPGRSDNLERVQYIRESLARLWPKERCDQAPRLLDVGSGLGVFPYRMRQNGWDCTAIDMDPALTRHVNQVVGIPTVVGDVTTIDGLGQFDLITFNKVLEHVADPVAILSGVRRLLKPGGYVYVELPDGEGAEIEGQEREEYLLGHIHVFSFASYALLGLRAGMSVVKCDRVREPSTKFTLRGLMEPAPEPDARA